MFPEQIAMRKARFTEHQIIAMLKSGMPEAIAKLVELPPTS